MKDCTRFVLFFLSLQLLGSVVYGQHTPAPHPMKASTTSGKGKGKGNTPSMSKHMKMAKNKRSKSDRDKSEKKMGKKGVYDCWDNERSSGKGKGKGKGKGDSSSSSSSGKGKNSDCKPTPAPNAVHPPTPAPNAVHPPTPAPNAVHPPTPAPNAVHPPTPAPNAVHPPTPAPNAVQPPTPAPNAVQPPTPAPNTDPVTPAPTDSNFQNACEAISAQCPWDPSATLDTSIFTAPGTGLYSQCTCNIPTDSTLFCFAASSCVCVDADAVINGSGGTCGGGGGGNTGSCNCVKGTIGAVGDTNNFCGGGGSCWYNYGDITGSGSGNICNGSDGCHCNGCTISDACPGANSGCNFNSGVIENPVPGSATTTCNCQNCCNFNGFEDGVDFGRVCDQSAAISANCGNGSCNCNRGKIVDGCTANDSCNNVPSCLKITGGCSTGAPGQCNFEPVNEENCNNRDAFLVSICSTFGDEFDGTFEWCDSTGAPCEALVDTACM